MNENNPRLKALANMAKRGTPNERIVAEKLLRELCKKHDLDYDHVLNDLLIEDFTFYFHYEKVNKDIAVQAMARYAMLEGEGSYSISKIAIYLKTTREKWNDFLAAIPEVKRLYNNQRKEMLARHRKERKLFARAFVIRHNLYYPYEIKRDENKKEKKLTDKDLADMQLVRRMAGDIDNDLTVHRQIGS